MNSSPNVALAIDSISKSIATHKDWMEWFNQHPEDEKLHHKTVHNAKEQSNIIAEYKNVLACLLIAKSAKLLYTELKKSGTTADWPFDIIARDHISAELIANLLSNLDKSINNNV